MKKGWQIKKIGDVCRLMTGGTPSRKKPDYFGGDIRWLVSGDIHQAEIFDCEGRITQEGMKNCNAKLLPVNSVMIALNGQGKTRGTVALLRTPATCNQSLVSISPNDPDELMPEFLYVNLHGRYQEIRTMTGDSGNDRRGLNMMLIRGIEIPIAPLSEQQRIVGLLSEAFAGLATCKANVEKNLQKARAIFDSYLHAVFTQPSSGWVDTTLVNALSVLRNGLNCKQDKSGKGTRISRIESIWNAEFDLTRVGYAELNEAQRSKFLLKKGDVLFSHINSSIHVGKTAFFNADEEVVHGVNLLLMRPQPTLLSEYLDLYLKFIFANGYWLRVCKQSINQASVNQQDINRVPIRYPDLEVQKAIVGQIRKLREETQRLASIYERKLAALDALKKSLLHQAFTGNL